jgi:hypothetical protein
MKVSDLNIEYTVKTLRIEEANYLDQYVIQVKFNDGTIKNVDFENFLSQSQHPEIKKYMDKPMFQSFTLLNGNLNWNDYDMIFPISELHEGKIT